MRGPDATATKRLKAAVIHDEARWRKVRTTIEKDGEVERFVARIRIPDGDVTSPHFLDDVAAACKKLTPFVAFVTEAVGLKM